LLFLFLLITPNTSIAQPATLELHRIWAIDLDQDVTALRLADLDGDGINEIFVGLWDGDSGYVEVFSGFNGILLQRSMKIPAHKIIDLDVGDIDGDQDREVVIGAHSITYPWYAPYPPHTIYVLAMPELCLDWQTPIVGEVKSIEVEDIDQDDTAEVFIGTTYRHSGYTVGHTGWFGWQRYSGNLYYMKPEDTTVIKMDASTGYWKLVAHDTDQDLCSEIVCVTFYGFGEVYGGWDPWREYAEYRETARVVVVDQDTSLYALSSFWSKWIFRPWVEATPTVTELAVGNCDFDEAKEIISYMDCGEEVWASGLILSVSDALTGIVENSTPYDDTVVGLAVLDINGQPPDEILIAHTNGTIEAINGMTFDTVAISDPLPPISFFAFGDVTEDAMPEICISDGDSLFLYGFGPTGVEEQKKEDLASRFILQQNFPNPFNPQTTIRYYLPQSSDVNLSIYNVMGQKVKTLVSDFQSQGFQSVTWDGTDKNGTEVASGIYFYRIKTDYSQETRKMVLMK